MQGLRTQESSRFVDFFQTVQNLAKRHNKVFFLDAGLGHSFKTETYEGENLQGWLIPMEKADLFEREFLEFKNGEEWDDFFAFLEWKEAEGDIVVFFEKYDDNETPEILN